MRHLVRGKKLSRKAGHRKATLSALSVALIKEHRIVTTVPKAKALRPYVEPLITKAKEDTSHNRRQVFSKLKDKKAVSHLFDEVAKKAMDRPGGYTRVVKMGYRQGDDAQMAVIELVDYNDIKPEEPSKKKKTRRAGKSNKPTSPEDTSTGKKEKEKEEKAKAETEAKAEAEEETAEAEAADETAEEAAGNSDPEATAEDAGEQSSGDDEEEEEKK